MSVEVDYRPIYQYRYQGVDPAAHRAVWRHVAAFLSRRFGTPDRVLGSAAGAGEFIAAVPARERWAGDPVDHGLNALPGVKVQIAPFERAELPSDHFDLIFVSNFLEHLPTPDAIAHTLSRGRTFLRPGGRLVVVGPNFRYCVREYFDCADHVLALPHRSVAEHLHGAGLVVVEDVVPRFLPYSFRPVVPASSWIIRGYLACPPAWRLFGKQFLVSATRADISVAPESA